MAANYVKTAYADIQTDDVVIITMQNANGVYAVSNDQGTSKAPVATEVTVADDAITTDATNILWTVTKDGANITFKSGENALYCTNTNNGVRVGSNEDNVFSIDATSGYLFNNATHRYIGVYNSQDFRCYTSVNNNIKEQTLAFFVLDEGGEEPVVEPELKTKTLYCKVAQDWWKADGAAVGVYAYGDAGVQNAAWPGVRMTAVEAAADTWTADIDVDLYHTVIFTRVNASGDIADWGAKTGDLQIPADKDLYTITSAEAQWAGAGNVAAGEWSVYGAEPEDPVVVEPEANYYLVGSMTEWAVVADEAHAFTVNPENDAEYQLNFTLAENDAFKVVKVEGESQTWYPEGMDNNYTVDAAHAGEKTIYFRPDGQGGEGWHYGVIYVAATPQPAAAVVLPATLDVTNVSFRSEGMPDFVIEEGQDYAGTYFDMGAHDSANDTLLYAEWNVTIQPIKYNVAVDVYNTNSWRVQLYLLNQAGDTLKSLRYKGSSGQKGQFAIGSMDLSDLEAGDYKVIAHAATAWSAMKLKDVIFAADYQGVSVELPGTLQPAYAELSSGASVANNAIAFAPATANNEYATWNVSFAEAGKYIVTIDMTAPNGHTYGVALLSADGAEQIGAVAEAQAWDTGVKELGAIAVPEAGNYVVKLTNATQWSEAVLNGITFAAAPKYYLAGTMNEWAEAAEGYMFAENPESEGEYMLTTTLAEGAEFKVRCGGDWYPAEGGNYVVDAAHAGENTIYFRPDGQGGEGWHYGVIYVAANEEPVVDEWAEIKFTEAVDAADLAENASFGVEGSEFSATITDTGNKMSIDANNCRFGDAEKYVSYSYRLKSGGKSSSSTNFITFNIPADGKLRIAVRTGSNSATDRNLVLAQGTDTLFNQVILESSAIKVTEGETEVNVYPYVIVDVKAGSLVASYPVNGVNFYSFAFKANPVVEEPAKFYITGDAALVGEELAWNPAAIKSTETSYKLNLAAGDYKLKVVVGEGEAAQWKGYDALTTIADGLTADEDGNICFTLTEAGEVNVHYDGEFFFLNGDFYVAPVVVHYYLKNNWDGGEWTWKEMVALQDGSYQLENVVFGGTGVNINTSASDEGSRYVAAENIPTMDMTIFDMGTLGALDTVAFVYTPSEYNSYNPDEQSGLSAFITGKYAAPVVETADFYIAGTMTSWADNMIAVKGTSHKLNLDAGEHKLKVVVGEGEAAQWLGYDALTTIAEGLTADADGNICFTLTEAGEVNVHYDGEFFFLNGEFYVAPVEVTYYLKNNWDGGEWAWKEMTDLGDGTYMLYNVVVGGDGVNLNGAASDEGASWFAWADIETYDASFEPATIGALDTVVIYFDPEAVNSFTGANGMSAQILGKYVPGETPQPVEHTYTVAGDNVTAFGTTWDPTNTANDMVKQEDGTYKWEKAELTLAAGTVQFKVTEDHAWTVAYPASDYQLPIAEAGIYMITITFNPETKAVDAVATKTGSAVVIPTIAMHGNFTGSWTDTENFTVAEGNETASLTMNLSAGNYEFGMRIGGPANWTANGVAFTRENASAEVVAGSGNLRLAADAEGEYTFTWTFATNTLAIEFPEGGVIVEPTLANGYYVIGLNGWEVTDLTENDMLLSTGIETGEYSLETTLAENDAFKVVQVVNDAIVAWFPEGDNNNYIVDQNHAGTTTIYFRPGYNGNEDWHAGCIFVTPTGTVDIDAIDANAPAVKVLHNGQILIKKGEKTYNVMGALVR